MREGKMQYAQCSMYARNYSEILRILDANRLSFDTFQNYNNDFELTNSNDTNKISKCLNGWNYDRQMFPNTVVMQVSYKFFRI